MQSRTEPLLPAVLIVDDDSDIALVLHDLLEHAGYRVQVAGTGAEALAKAKADSLLSGRVRFNAPFTGDAVLHVRRVSQ